MGRHHRIAGRRAVPPSSVPVPARSAPGVGLLVATAMANGTFTSSLSARSAIDQGIVTGLTTGLHHLLSVSTQDLLEAAGRFLADGAGGGAAPAAGRRWNR